MTREPEPEHPRLRPRHAEPHPGPGPGATSRPTRRPACRSRRPSSAPAVRGRLPVPVGRDTRRSGTRTRTTSSRASASRTRSTRRPSCAAASGLYVAPFQVTGVPGLGNPINQFGYSRNTPVDRSAADNGLTFVGDLTRPVPSGTLLEPIGSSQGLRTNLGGNVGATTRPRSSRSATTRRSGASRSASSASCPGNFVVELTYLGQRGQNIPYRAQLNFVPEQFRTQEPDRNNAAEHVPAPAVCRTRSAASPPRTPGTNGATIARSRLLAAVPALRQLDQRVLRRLEPLRRRLHPPGEAVHQGVHAVDLVHLLALPREGGAPQPVGGPGGPRRRRGPARTASPSPAWPSCPSARAASGAATGAALVDALLGGWQLGGRFECQSGPAPRPGTTSTSTPAAATPRTSCSRPGATTATGRSTASTSRSSTRRCFYTFNGQPFRNAAGQRGHVPGRRRSSCGAANIRRFPTTLPDVRFQNHHILDIGLTKNFIARRAA